MIEWLLKELEKNPAGVFRKQDLLKQSKEQFEELKSLKLLTYIQSDLNCETYPCSLPCENACPMEVVEMDNKLYAICPQDSEIDPISLNRNELDKYQFSIEKFLELVQSANKLDGSLHEIESGYFYFGHTTYKNVRVGFAFGIAITRESILKLTGLKSLCVDDYYLVIFSPVSLIEDISHRKELDSEKIVQTSFASLLNFQTYEFSIDKIVSGILERRAETEQKDQTKKEPSKEAKNVFKKSGDYWLVAYQGSATNTIKDSKGMFYIHRLLGKPDESISAMELAHTLFDVELLKQGSVADDLLDRDYWKECQNRFFEIEREFDEAVKNKDLATQKRLDEEKEKICSLLKSDTFRGKSAKFSDDKEKARKAVSKAITTALYNLKKHNTSLYQHLKNSIQCGSYCTYTTDTEINWQL